MLVSQSNELDTEIDIKSMAMNLANEVQGAVLSKLGSKQPFLLSFLGHSLGGLIIRRALPLLAKYHQNLHTFVSLGTPHAGLNVQ